MTRNQGFKVTVYLQIEHLKNGVRDFTVAIFFDIEYLKKVVR